MVNSVQSGILYGRPYGGVITLISRNLRKVTETLCCSDRFTIIRIADYLIINVYLPCDGTAERLLICEDILADVQSWRDKYWMCDCIVAGDFNSNLDSTDKAAAVISDFLRLNSLTRCDHIFPSDCKATYVNDYLGQQSYIDYITTSSPGSVLAFNVLDPDINFSDHLPLYASIRYCAPTKPLDTVGDSRHFAANNNRHVHKKLRWDKADLDSYYGYTRIFESMLGNCDEVIESVNLNGYCDNECQFFVDRIYNDVVSVLNNAAHIYVPQSHKNFYKFWWGE